MKKQSDIDVDRKICLSTCCNASTSYCPPALGDEGFMVCSACMHETEDVDKPVYEKIDKGTYRKIQYTKQLTIKNT